MVDVIRHYDIICFGDEVPGILAVVTAAREHFRRLKKYPRSLVMFKGNSQYGIGGHLVRGGLSYLDRSVVAKTVRDKFGLPTYGDESAIYEEFLSRTAVKQVGLDPNKASTVLRKMLSEVGADILDNIDIESVNKNGADILSIRLTKGEVYQGKVFIDSTVNAELAQFAGVRKLKGFETFGLPNSELSVTLTFEIDGVSVDRLKQVEMLYMKRFANLADKDAQGWINVAAGGNKKRADELREAFVTNKDNLGKIAMYAGVDFIDVRSYALSIAYHSFRGTQLSLAVSNAVLDKANIAILPSGRMSWNALLFDVNADEAEALARNGSRPTLQMLDEMALLAQWFKVAVGAKTVRRAPELYIRHAGNVTSVIDPLTGTEMLQGGIPASQALGTFGYHFDIRGGIDGLSTRAGEKGLGAFTSKYLPAPLFNIGIQHTLLRNVPNLSVISPASGFEGYASSCGRIVEFNCAVGEGVGIAAAASILTGRKLNQISDREVRQVLVTTGKLSKIYGQPNSGQEEIAELQNFEQSMMADTIPVNV